MKQFTPLLILLTVFYSCSNDKKETPVTDNLPAPVVVKDSALVTDTSWGLITSKADIASLQSLYGIANIKDERVCGPECADSIDVTFIYRNTKNEMTIYWNDSAYHKTISFIESSDPEASYHTATGLKTGSALNDLLKLNGKKITFSGFDWDYGGLIQSYNDGILENSPVHFQLGLYEDGYDSLIGDIELNTDMPAVKKALDKIKVTQLSLTFN